MKNRNGSTPNSASKSKAHAKRRDRKSLSEGKEGKFESGGEKGGRLEKERNGKSEKREKGEARAEEGVARVESCERDRKSVV